MITQEQLKEYLHYDPETGIFTWTKATGNKNQPGKIAGDIRKDGYRRIRFLDRKYLSHRLAWLYMTGDFPPIGRVIDHIDRDPSNNAWANLRLATIAENGANQKKRNGTSSKYKGVYFYNAEQIWIAKGKLDGKIVQIGRFHDEDLAGRARNEWAAKTFGEYAYTGSLERGAA